MRMTIGCKCIFHIFIIIILLEYCRAEGSSDICTDEHHLNKSNSLYNVESHSDLSQNLIMTIFILFIVFLNVVYEHLTFLPSHLPESNMLILVGVLFGAFMKYALKLDLSTMTLNSHSILLILLPPIILDAAYTLNDRTFFEVSLPVLIFAFMGTFANFILIGGILSFVYGNGTNLTSLACFMYSSLIVAVDPVAVLAIFHELKVNDKLYFLVFGESLFNDAVTLVLFNSMLVLMSIPQLLLTDIILVIVSLFTVSIGGITIGVFIGITCCIATKVVNCELMSPVLIFASAYLSYLVADIFKCSGMISLIGCGLIQAIYAFQNVNEASRIFIKSAAATLAVLSEECIFLYLGFAWFQIPLAEHFDIKFSITALFTCLVVRFIVIYSFSFILHRSNILVHDISFTEQFVLAYGGLRGAVSFALAMLLDGNLLTKNNASKCSFMLSTMFIILVTVVPMGLTIKPLVKCMHIAMSDEHEKEPNTATSYVAELTISHIEAGIETILGHFGLGTVTEKLLFINEKLIRPFLQKDPQLHSGLLSVCEGSAGNSIYRPRGSTMLTSRSSLKFHRSSNRTFRQQSMLLTGRPVGGSVIFGDGNRGPSVVLSFCDEKCKESVNDLLQPTTNNQE